MNEKVEIPVAGMSCEGCSGNVARSLQALPGVRQVHVSLRPGLAQVEFDPRVIQLPALEAAIEEAGFDVVR